MAEHNNDELEDFLSIEEGGKLQADLCLSNVYSVKVGGFGEQNLRTYIGCLTVEDLAEDVQFYETLSKDKSWPVSQIVQREVDKIRVSNIARDYILGKGRVVKYFPPIVIALLPKGIDGKIDLKFDFANEQTDEIKNQIFERSVYRTNAKMREVFKKGNNLSKIKSLFLLKVSEVFDLNVLCWDKSKYYAIVIDGQHRLDALIKSKETNPEVGKYIQDVVFVDISQLMTAHEGKYSPVELVRRLFIDINTNAKKVGIVRQILMDDKDLAALLVQSLVDSVNKDGSDKLPETFLKSQIVDWYGESLKHTLPHITGILSLYQILGDYLIQYNLSSIDDLRSPSKVANWVKRMNEYFFVDREIEENEAFRGLQKISDALAEFNGERDIVSTLEGIDDELKESTLFQYNYTVLEVAQKSFEKIYSKSIVKIFAELLPYKETLEIISLAKGFDQESNLSVALLSSGKKIYASQALKESLSAIRIELEVKLFERYFLLFSVLGQKSLFNLFFKRIFKNFTTGFDESACDLIAQKFIEDINFLLQICNRKHPSPFGKKDQFIVDYDENHENLIDLGTVASSFWEGIIYEDNKIIYNSQGISSLSATIEYMLHELELLKTGSKESTAFNISYMKPRTVRIIRKRFGLEKAEADEYAEQVIEMKGAFIKNYLQSAFAKQ